MTASASPAPTRREFLGATALSAAAAVGLPALGGVTPAAAVPVTPRSTPHGLLTSLLADPLGVEPGHPRLSWIVPDLLPSSRQVAYQIQVSHTADDFVASGGTVWDSGRVESSNSVAIEYAGPALEPAAGYYWRVRTWVANEHAKRSAQGVPSEWSEPQRVVTAAGDTWDAVPIWARDGSVSLGDGRLDVDVTITTVSIGLFLKAQDVNNTYLWQVMAGDPGRIRPHVRVNGAYTLFEDVDLPVPVPVGSPFRVSVELDGPVFRTYVDGTLVHERSDSRFHQGTFGFRNGLTESQRIHTVRFTDSSGEVLVDEDFSAGPGPFLGGTVEDGDLVVGTSAHLLARLGETRDWAVMRTEFDVADKKIATAFLYATGRTPEPARQYVYKAWVNSEFAGVGPARAKGSEARYQTHDVTHLVAPGRNALAALCWAEQDRRFLAQLVVVFADGTRQVLGTSSDWRVRRGGRWLPPGGGLNTPYYSAPSENIDARFEPVGWTEPGFDDSAWETAEEAAPISDLRSVPVEPMRISVVRPTDVTQLAPGRWRVDLGREIVGGIRLSVEGAAGTTVEVRLGEELNADGTVRYRLRAGNIYRETWTLRDGQQSIEHWGYRGFRWVELLSDPGFDLSQAVEGLMLAMAWNADDASFASSNPDLDRVWEMCRYSIEASRQDVYQDTPTRERGPYEGDAIINQLSEYYTQRSYALARYSTTLLASRPTWPTEYRIMSVLLTWEDYLATGDPTHLAVDYDIFVARNLDDFLNGAGLVEKDPGSSSQVNGDLVDWPAANRDGYVFRRVNTVINSWQYAAYSALARVAEVIGREDHAALYSDRAASLRAAINRDLLVDGSYLDGVGTTHRAQHATVFPVALGVAADADLAVLGEWLAQGGMRVGLYGAQFLLDALYRCGRGDAALGLMTSSARESWLHMIDDLGATWVMESWDPAIKPNTTFSHAWGSAPANVVGRRLAGVRLLEPGAARVDVTPQPGDLDWFTARVPTIRGPVEVAFDRRDGFRLSVVLPPNVSGRLELSEAIGLPDLRALRVWTRGPAPRRREEPGRLVLLDVPPGELRIARRGEDG